MKKNLLIAAVSLVIVSILAGLFIVGSPLTARKENLDRQKLSRISRILSDVLLDNANSSLSDIEARLKLVLEDIKNPETDEPFDYKMNNDGKILICANFYFSSNESGSSERFWPGILQKNYSVDWQHEAGYDCIEAELS